MRNLRGGEDLRVESGSGGVRALLGSSKSVAQDARPPLPDLRLILRTSVMSSSLPSVATIPPGSTLAPAVAPLIATGGSLSSGTQ